MISDEQVDNLVQRFMSDHGTLLGYSLVTGHLRSLQVSEFNRKESGRVLTALTLETLESAGLS